MTRDMNDRVADYRGLVESLAAGMVRTKSAINARAEYDDLVQEGLIHVWEALERGITPAKKQIQNRMRKWIRLMARQRRGEVSLDELLERIEAEDSQLDADVRRLVQDQE